MSGVLRVQAQRLVRSGVEYLDRVAATGHEIVPVRWHRVVDPSILDVAWPMRCVLAQVGQASLTCHALLDYEGTARALGMEPHPTDRDADVIRRGFHALPGDDAVEEYHYLTLAWKWVILHRQAGDHPLRRMTLAI